MLLRNLNLTKGLYNGSRLCLLQVCPSVLLCEIVKICYCSQEVLILRITHHYNDSRLPFTLCWRQFPVTGAFAMTINKLQGQSNNRVGIYLRNEVFSHGQLYVALFHGRHSTNIKVANENANAVGMVKNVVYHKVFAWPLSCRFLQISTLLIRWMEKLRVYFKLCMFRVHARFGDVPFHPTVFFWCLPSCNLLFQLRHVTRCVNKDRYT